MSSINTSNIEAQKQIRIQKMNKLKALGFDPFPVTSHRDFDIGFIKFWFDFLHKFDLIKLESDDSNFLLEHYLYQSMFPPTLVETFEEKIQMRHTVRQMGMDPDSDIDSNDIDYDENTVQQIRSLLPNLQNKNKLEKEDLFYGLVVDKSEVDSTAPSGEGITLSLSKNQTLTIAGRIKKIRASGKIIFAVIEDESCPEGIQVILKKDVLNRSTKEILDQTFSAENIKKQLGLE
jgi:lysyl-tRNA synthetase class II